MPTFRDDPKLGSKVPMIKTADLNEQCVTNSKILDGCITKEKLAKGTVDATTLANKSVGTEKLSDSSVTNEKISNKAVSTEKLADGSITKEKIFNASITTEKLANESVSAEKLQFGLRNTIASTYDKTIELENQKANIADVGNAIERLENKIGERFIVEGDVINLPDEEDLTSVSTIDGREVMKLNDRAYDPSNFSGKGYKILRKNIKKFDIPTVNIVVSYAPTSSGDISITVNNKVTTINLDSTTDTTPAIVATKIAAALKSSLDDYDVSISSNRIILTRHNSSSVSPSSINVGNTSAVISVTDGVNKDVRKNVLTDDMINDPNTIYEIKYDYDLNAENITVAPNSIIKFKGGSLINGSLIGDNTLLEGNIKIGVKLDGVFNNDKIKASCILYTDFSVLSKIIVSLFNIGLCLYVDTDLILDSSTHTVNSIFIDGDGKHYISNPISFRVNGTIIVIKNINIKEYNNNNGFISISDYSKKNIKIEMDNLIFDGNNNCIRFYNHINSTDDTITKAKITNCIFKNILEVCFYITGEINDSFIDNNIFDGIGDISQKRKRSMGILMGRHYSFVKEANNNIISNNKFYNIKACYSDVNDAKETHAILIYGNNNNVVYNYVGEIKGNGEDNDPGAETEGIYLKGSGNNVSYNRLINAVGSLSDGAITIKHFKESTDISKNNIIANNFIIANHSAGIVNYTYNTIIKDNNLILINDARNGINISVAKNVKIVNNIIDSSVSAPNTFNGFFVAIESYNNVYSDNKSTGEGVNYNLLQCDYIYIYNNTYNLTAKIDGGILRYTSIIKFQKSTKNVFIKDSVFNIGSIRCTALIDSEKMAIVKILNSYFNIFKDESLPQESYIKGLFRNGNFEINGCSFNIDPNVNVSRLFLDDESTDILINSVMTNKIVTVGTTKVIGTTSYINPSM